MTDAGGTPMSGGEAIVRALTSNGIDTVFGLPGAQTYPIFDALERLEVPTYVTRHEQGAAYMAFGAAKSTGRPSAFCVVPGPGILNTAAALCTAAGTCSPVLGVTGQIPSSFAGKGRGHLHELPDQRGTLASFIGSAFSIPSAAAAGQVINHAVATMRSGRPGPAAVEMAWDTMASVEPVLLTEPPPWAPSAHVEGDVDRAAELIDRARRPLVMCGAGAQEASAELRAFVEKLGAPVTAFRSGRGVIPADHPLWVDPVAARLLWDSVDLVIGIGSRLEMASMRWGDMEEYHSQLGGDRRLIRLDTDRDEFERLVPDVGILGDSATAVPLLTDTILGKTARYEPDELDRVRQQARVLYQRVQPQVSYLDAIREAVPRDGFIVPELTQVGFASYFALPIYEPRTYVTEGFQGTLGFGFQTALGVKVANPARAVVSITGDGGFMFGIQELATAAQYDIATVTVVFDNGGFGNVRRDQDTRYGGRRIGADLRNPDFVSLVRSFGIDAELISAAGELAPALERALDAEQPRVIVVQDPTPEASPWPFIMMPDTPG